MGAWALFSFYAFVAFISFMEAIAHYRDRASWNEWPWLLYLALGIVWVVFCVYWFKQARKEKR